MSEPSDIADAKEYAEREDRLRGLIAEWRARCSPDLEDCADDLEKALDG
jgi:hypothetical protein